MPYLDAVKISAKLNGGSQKRSLTTRDFHFTPMTGEVCPDGIIPVKRRDLKTSSVPMTRGLHRRVALSPGWNTTGDSSVHTARDGRDSR